MLLVLDDRVTSVIETKVVMYRLFGKTSENGFIGNNFITLVIGGKLLFDIIFMKSREDLADGKEIYYNIAWNSFG